MISFTLIAKLCNSQSRGTMFAVTGIAANIVIVILEAYGGNLYSLSILAPFLYWYIGCILITLLTLILYSMGKLKIWTKIS